jgi:MraZ protein
VAVVVRELISMFRGNHPTRVDEKGRLKVPAEFKRVIDEKYGTAILHHKSGWEGCSTISLRGMGADRAEAGRALQFQSYEEKVSRPHQLLRAAGRDGRAGTVVAAAVAAAKQGQIKGEVAVLGNLTYLVVRNLELFKREIVGRKVHA